MRNIKNSKIIISAIALMLLGQNSFAQNQNKVPANATAKIIKPLIITKNKDMLFGSMATISGTGNSTVGSDGTKTGSVMLLQSSTRNNAEFSVAGESNETFVASFTNNNISLVSESNSSDTMNVALQFVGGGDTITKTFDPNGNNQTLTVKGDVTVTDSQAPGNYKGTFEVVVNY